MVVDSVASIVALSNAPGESATIDDEKATVLCGNIPTANATVYIIDGVLLPAS